MGGRGGIGLARPSKPLHKFTAYFGAVPMVTTAIQTVAAVIQAGAAAVFLIGVRYDYMRRRDERLESIIRKLHQQWRNEIHDTVTVQERDGIYSPRQIDYFNKRLQELGQPWVVSGDYVPKFRRRR